MGVAGFLLGTAAGQLFGAWAYRRVLGYGAAQPMRKVRAALAAGLVTTAVTTVIYIPFHVHTWAGGDGTPWGMSVFLGLCMGICQGALFRGRPFLRETRSP